MRYNVCKMNKYLKEMIRLVKRNGFIFIFSFILLFVLTVVGYRILFAKKTYVYVKVKVSQGYWWAATQKPSMWHIEALQKAKIEKGLSGNPTAELLQLTYYPWYNTPGQYDVYMVLKLVVSKLGKTDKYIYKRSPIGVGAAIDFEFPLVQVSGTVIDMSTKPIVDKYVTKTVYMTKKDAYTKDYPYTYDNIKIGDKSFNGVTTIFQVLDKKLEPQIWSVSNNLTGSVVENRIETNQNIIVKAQVKGVLKNGRIFFAEEQALSEGKDINVSTTNYTFRDFIVSRIE